MYIHLQYIPGDRSAVESVRKTDSRDLRAERTFFLNALDNDGDAIRFHLNDGSHFDAIFMEEASARAVYDDILTSIRENRGLAEMDIRTLQAGEPC